jgi:hypothetical protein
MFLAIIPFPSRFEPKEEGNEDLQPRIEAEEGCVDESVPPPWIRLIKAPLQDHLSLPVLLRYGMWGSHCTVLLG